METTSRSSGHFDRAKLDVLVDPIVRAHGGEVVEIELKSEPGGWVLRVMVEKAGSEEAKLSTRDAAIDLEICSNIARELSPALDAVDIIAHAYNLEVGSPGVERPLKREQDFQRFVGQKAKLKLKVPVRGQQVVVGEIGPIEDNHLAILEGTTTHRVPVADIVSANLVFEFGRGESQKVGPKPGKKKSHRG